MHTTYVSHRRTRNLAFTHNMEEYCCTALLLIWKEGGAVHRREVTGKVGYVIMRITKYILSVSCNFLKTMTTIQMKIIQHVAVY